MLVFRQKTGELAGILLDEGYLTDVRTALAGALVARYLAPRDVQAIGVVGTGVQARLQVRYLKGIVDCQQIYVWGRSQESAERYAQDMRELGCSVATTTSIADVARNSQLIITATPSTRPLLYAAEIRPGTHITALGADTKGKQELDPAVLERADILVVDSLSQCAEYGETSHALEQHLIAENKPIEIGRLRSANVRRTSDMQITIADLTGVAVQDIVIAEFVYTLATHEPPFGSDVSSPSH